MVGQKTILKSRHKNKSINMNKSFTLSDANTEQLSFKQYLSARLRARCNDLTSPDRAFPLVFVHSGALHTISFVKIILE